MTHKQFWGRDINEALSVVRRALGADALITETKTLDAARGGGVEITALASDDGADSAAQSPAPDNVFSHRDSVATDELRRELAVVKSMVSWLAPSLSQANPAIHALVNHGVLPENITKLCRALENTAPGEERARWAAALKRSLPPLRERKENPRRLAFVGPSGVGKSSALIKLTLYLAQRRSTRVAWITMDQRRLSGADMLPVYAGVLGVRVEHASNRAELKVALERLADHELILIDTPGINPRDDKALSELGKALQPFDIASFLVLSAVGNGAELLDCVGRYRSLGVQSLLFTKVDECRYLGPLFNTALGTELPLSYITFGQNFAEEIAQASPDVLASLISTGVTQ